MRLVKELRMRTSIVAMIVSAVLAGGAFLTVSMCINPVAVGSATQEALPEGAAPFPFALADLATPPRAWYCLFPRTQDPVKERRGMELFAWRLFIALNWPGRVEEEWMPDVNMDLLNTPSRYPRWASWHTPRTLYKSLADCDTPIEPPAPNWSCDDDCLVNSIEAKGSDISSSSHRCVYDQNGRAVHYEIRLAQDGWVDILRDTLCDPEYTGGSFGFRYGQCAGKAFDEFDVEAATAVKLAWKVLSNEERESHRFLQRVARVSSVCPPDGSAASEATLGLVAFHITHKSSRYGHWVWSTFEHVDNLEPAEGAKAASFHDPSCVDCLPNASQRAPGRGCRTQIARTTPISGEVQELNASARKWLRAEKTVLQYYQLIGVQYISDTGSPATPEELRNPLLETYQVVGRPRPMECMPEPEPVEEPSSCLGCHSTAKVDFSFVPERSLCNCKDKKPWIGDEKCQDLGIVCQ
jgi:hypothetical protein